MTDYDPILKTWPERRVLGIQADKTPILIRTPERLIQTTMAQWFWPGYPTLITEMGGMPRTPEDVLRSPHGMRTAIFWDQVAVPASQAHLRQLMVEQECRYTWHTVWWEHEGHRIYVLDETTAIALLYTNLDNYPTKLLKLPVRSFFLRVPESLGWRCDLPEEWAGSGADSGIPGGGHELKQPLDGFVITGEYDTDDRLIKLSVLLGGRAQDFKEDNVHWFELDLQFKTLGDVLNQLMVPAEGAQPEFINREAMRIILGTILYITSAHPELRALPPHPKPESVRKKKHKRLQRVYESQSAYRVVLVGGPKQGFRKAEVAQPIAGKPEVEALKRKPPEPHKRDGHWRWQAVGRRGDNEHKHIWIQPVDIGDWNRIVAYESVKNMQMVIRKTRPADLAVKP